MANATDIIAPIEMQTTYAFQMEVGYKYDADAQAFIFGKEYGDECSSTSYSTDKGTFICNLKTALEPSEKYQAQNGYGDPPSFQWTPMLAFRSWRGVSDEREA
ncbi:MAG: hypothetical protein DI526_08150, partial [Caulobacter segnis]